MAVAGHNIARGSIPFQTAFGNPDNFMILEWTIKQAYGGGTFYQNIDLEVDYDISARGFRYVLYNNNSETYTIPCKITVALLDTT